jgi:hypothetical protein
MNLKSTAFGGLMAGVPGAPFMTIHQHGDFMTEQRIKYTGSGPLTYYSAPSGKTYFPDTGVEFEPLKEDKEFFRNIAERANNPFEVV